MRIDSEERKKARQYEATYRRKNKDRARRFQLNYYYGISLERYGEMLTAQKGVCAICARSSSGKHRLCVDHDHVTGKIRGLLCHACNTALGLFGESQERVMKASNYLNSAGKRG